MIMSVAMSRSVRIAPGESSPITPDPVTRSSARSVIGVVHDVLPAATSDSRAQRIGSLMVLAVRTFASAPIAKSFPVSRFFA